MASASSKLAEIERGYVTAVPVSVILVLSDAHRLSVPGRTVRVAHGAATVSQPSLTAYDTSTVPYQSALGVKLHRSA